MRKLLFSLALLVGFASQALAADNYAATAGSGLTFGAKDAAGVLYSRFIGCDNTTVSQCWAVDASGRQAVAMSSGSVASGAFASGSIASGAVSAGAYAAGALAAGALATGSGVDGWDITQGAKADSVCATATGTCSVVALLKYLNNAVNSSIPAGTALIGDVNLRQGGAALSATNGAFANVLQGNAVLTAANPLPTAPGPYPLGATPYTATATGTTAATTATLAGASSVTTYLCGFSIRANATAAVTGNATVTGVITATLNFTQWTAPNASGLGITEMIFAPCIPASAANTSIAVVSAAPGTGGVVSVTAWGYKL